MEQNNLPIVAKRIWSIVRVVYFMLRKTISKKKLMLDLNIMMKRGKLASKALSNLITVFHHHHGGGGASSSSSSSSSGSRHLDYEFSCSNSPAFPGLFHLTNKKSHARNPFACAHAPPTAEDLNDLTAVKAVLEMLNYNEVEASPALPGFGRTPRVRPLRITDSPFPLKEVDEDSEMVDRAAEEFIKKFYRDLKQQKGSRLSD